METDEAALLLELLNSRPVSGGVERDRFADEGELRAWARAHDGSGTAREAERLRTVREGLAQVIRGERGARALAPALEGAARVPELGDTGVSWRLTAPPDAALAARIVLAWARIEEELPGRLRPCGNEECRLFLLDRSRAGRARWCSMAACGNRLKARRHYERARAPRGAVPRQAAPARGERDRRGPER
ncbi:CGNR zinc finger domain-containing protein [Streptomyces sp. SBT349]|uniref:CGNR zinc finger domain-containing protein n=1 Tax=Streptomyces sp. SBT349 TaxID=1580539 RepID=UPI0007C6AA2D|nr:CGNR zinc finger domain-containing protein [Streptomyces sp. SBT349]